MAGYKPTLLSLLVELQAMNTAKEEVRLLLERLPDEASFEDIQYHIYVQEAIRRGREAAARGELVEQDEIERRMSKWLGE
jgi:predicted transcriptional regulator